MVPKLGSLMVLLVEVPPENSKCCAIFPCGSKTSIRISLVLSISEKIFTSPVEVGFGDITALTSIYSSFARVSIFR